MNIIPVAEAASVAIKDVSTLIEFLSDLLQNRVLPLLIGLAVVGFIYGVLKYFLNPDNEDKRKNGKDFMTWGLISLFVMISFWGIIAIFQTTLTKDVDKSGIKIPSIPTQTQN